MFHRFDVIHELDGQTDGRTLHDSKDRAYASHRAVKFVFGHKSGADCPISAKFCRWKQNSIAMEVT